MSTLVRNLHWFVCGFVVIYLSFEALPPEEPAGKMHLYEFGKIPVVDGGRVKPIDTVARTSLMALNGHQQFKDTDKKEQPAIKWLLDVMTSRLNKDSPVEKYKVFQIANDEVLNLLGLEPKSPFLYSISQFVDKIGDLDREANRAARTDAKERTLYDRKLLELGQQLENYAQLSQWNIPLMVPPRQGDEWQPFFQAVVEARNKNEDNPPARSLGSILLAYAEGNADKFNEEVATYEKWLEANRPQDLEKTSFEAFFNHFKPFYWAAALCCLAFLITCISWLVWTESLNSTAFWLLVTALALDTWALGSRMYIQGRPPVTNLYSAAVFIGWGCVILGLSLEHLYRNGMGNVVASVMGLLSLIVAHNLAGSGDTLEMMQAVLDTNFWLATHVTCVSTGYTATFVAGLLGIIFVLRGVFTDSLGQNQLKPLSQMIYGIICFATFFSFVGTVLGGIWADQSWGRFWGWDPKENGALMIVLWNALVLHARWAGMIKQRGMAVLAIFGNIVTAWSMFGVNMLGVGLHSYGFTEGSMLFWVTFFVVSQLVLMAVGMLPLRMWRSFQQEGNTSQRKVAHTAAAETVKV
jgi:ABC-type transport system involved in cytochrome c biogenesis permease subunit